MMDPDEWCRSTASVSPPLDDDEAPLRDIDSIREEITRVAERRRSARFLPERQHAAVQANLLDGGAATALVEAHERVRHFYQLIQHWMEDNSFPFIEEWIGVVHDDPAAMYEAKAREQEDQLLVGLKAQVREIMQSSAGDEEKVTKLAEVTRQQKMLLLRRVRRMKELAEAQSSLRRQRFREDVERAIEGERPDLTDVVRDNATLVRSVNALLGKLFVFIRACVERGRVARPDKLKWFGESYSLFADLPGCAGAPFDMIKLPDDLESISLLAAGGFKFPLGSLEEAKAAEDRYLSLRMQELETAAATATSAAHPTPRTAAVKSASATASGSSRRSSLSRRNPLPSSRRSSIGSVSPPQAALAQTTPRDASFKEGARAPSAEGGGGGGGVVQGSRSKSPPSNTDDPQQQTASGISWLGATSCGAGSVVEEHQAHAAAARLAPTTESRSLSNDVVAERSATTSNADSGERTPELSDAAEGLANSVAPSNRMQGNHTPPPHSSDDASSTANRSGQPMGAPSFIPAVLQQFVKDSAAPLDLHRRIHDHQAAQAPPAERGLPDSPISPFLKNKDTNSSTSPNVDLQQPEVPPHAPSADDSSVVRREESAPPAREVQPQPLREEIVKGKKHSHDRNSSISVQKPIFEESSPSVKASAAAVAPTTVLHDHECDRDRSATRKQARCEGPPASSSPAQPSHVGCQNLSLHIEASRIGGHPRSFQSQALSAGEKVAAATFAKAESNAAPRTQMRLLERPAGPQLQVAARDYHQNMYDAFEANVEKGRKPVVVAQRCKSVATTQPCISPPVGPLSTISIGDGLPQVGAASAGGSAQHRETHQRAIVVVDGAATPGLHEMPELTSIPLLRAPQGDAPAAPTVSSSQPSAMQHGESSNSDETAEAKGGVSGLLATPARPFAFTDEADRFGMTLAASEQLMVNAMIRARFLGPTTATAAEREPPRMPQRHSNECATPLLEARASRSATKNERSVCTHFLTPLPVPDCHAQLSCCSGPLRDLGGDFSSAAGGGGAAAVLSITQVGEENRAPWLVQPRGLRGSAALGAPRSSAKSAGGAAPASLPAPRRPHSSLDGEGSDATNPAAATATDRPASTAPGAFPLRNAQAPKWWMPGGSAAKGTPTGRQSAPLAPPAAAKTTMSVTTDSLQQKLTRTAKTQRRQFSFLGEEPQASP